MTKRETDPRLTDPSVDRSLTGMEALADAWGVEVSLPGMVTNIVSPMRLNKNVPNEVREDFIARMENMSIHAAAVKAIEWFHLDPDAMSANSDEEQQQRTELKSVLRVRMISLAHEKRISHPVAFVLTQVKLEGSPVL